MAMCFNVYMYCQFIPRNIFRKKDKGRQLNDKYLPKYKHGVECLLFEKYNKPTHTIRRMLY